MQIIKPESFQIAAKPAPTTSNAPPAVVNNNVPGNPFKCTNLFVTGAGKMGSLVATELAIHGYLVTIHDGLTWKTETLMARVYEKLQHAVANGLLQSAEDIPLIASRITIAKKLEEARDADIIFECCAESVSTKANVYQYLDSICPKTTIIASNTINMPLSTIIPNCKRFPQRVLGTRFLFPVLFIPRVEMTCIYSSKLLQCVSLVMVDYLDPYSFAVKKMLQFLKSINKKPYFYSGSGERETLAHEQVVATYQDEALQFKKLGSYLGKVTIAKVFNPADANAPVSAPPASLATLPTTSTSPPSTSTSTATSPAPNQPVVAPKAPATGDKAPEADDSKKCVVCMEVDRNCVLIPCGHICSCFNCGDSITKSATPICPICRVDIKSVVMTFVA